MSGGAPRDAFTGGEFVAVRREAVIALGSWEAAGVWQRICWRADRTGSWVATIEQIAEDVCLTVPKTRTALKVIRATGWITSERASGRDRTLRWIPIWSEASVDQVLNVEQESVATPLTETVEDHPLSVPPVGAQLTLVGAPAVERVDTIEVEFEAFWSHWPDKRGKAPALRAYRAARRKAPMEAIAAGFRAHLPVLLAKIENGDRQYVPHAATWLNQERWADPAPPMPRARIAGDPYAHLDPSAPSVYGSGGIYGAPVEPFQPAATLLGGPA